MVQDDSKKISRLATSRKAIYMYGDNMIKSYISHVQFSSSFHT